MDAYLNENHPIIKTFVLTADEHTRFNRMLVRGDKLKDAKERIARDKIEFDKEKVKNAHYFIETDSLSIEEVADKIFEIYSNL